MSTYRSANIVLVHLFDISRSHDSQILHLGVNLGDRSLPSDREHRESIAHLFAIGRIRRGGSHVTVLENVELPPREDFRSLDLTPNFPLKT